MTVEYGVEYVNAHKNTPEYARIQATADEDGEDAGLAEANEEVNT